MYKKVVGSIVTVGGVSMTFHLYRNLPVLTTASTRDKVAETVTNVKQATQRCPIISSPTVK